MENIRATPSAVVVSPTPAKGGRGALLAVAAAVLVLAVLAAAWIYKSQQRSETVASGMASASPQSPSATATSPPSQDASATAQQPTPVSTATPPASPMGE